MILTFCTWTHWKSLRSRAHSKRTRGFSRWPKRHSWTHWSHILHGSQKGSENPTNSSPFSQSVCPSPLGSSRLRYPLEPNITVGLTVFLLVHVQNILLTRKHLQTLSSKARLHTAHLKHHSSTRRASLDMLLATSGHIPLAPAEVVKANTLQGRKISIQLQPQGQKNEKFHRQRLVIHTLYSVLLTLFTSFCRADSGSEHRLRKISTTIQQRVVVQTHSHRPNGGRFKIHSTRLRCLRVPQKDRD